MRDVFAPSDVYGVKHLTDDDLILLRGAVTETLDPKSEVVQLAYATARSLGFKPSHFAADGGLDANWLSARGVPTVTFGAGQHSPHTEEEYVDLREYLGGCRLAVALASPQS